MRSNRKFGWVILVLVIVFALILSSNYTSEIGFCTSESAIIENRLFPPDNPNKRAFLQEKRMAKMNPIEASTKTDRPLKRLSEIELALAQDEFEKVKKRYMPKHPEFLDAERQVQELNTIVHSTAK